MISIPLAAVSSARIWSSSIREMVTLESVEVLCGLEVADVETALALAGIEDAAPVLREDVFSGGRHFPNNL